MSMRQWVDKLLGRQTAPAAPTSPPPDPTRDPGAMRDPAADEREMRTDAVNKAVEESDSKRDTEPPSPAP